MKLSELEKSYLLSFTLDHQNLYIEFYILAEDGKQFKVFANNIDTSPITVNFVGLNIRANLTTSDNVPCLGEIESVFESDSGFYFEGDIGTIEVKASNYSVEKAI
ncbi:hypothetical protein FQP88_24165 [Vibrio atlanticus]|nr:hypothetical protein FQP88_24165 [Vibrio atlanticus]